MSHEQIKAVFIGGLNTDIIAKGVHTLLKSGELTRSGELVIGPGGKSRNMAQMMAVYHGRDTVAMVGRTSKDPFNLWKVPCDALKKAGVITDYIKVMDMSETGKLPGVALIPVNRKGENQIYCIPGINDDFCPADIDNAAPLFESLAKNDGILALSLELPLETAVYAVKKAIALGLRVVLDPGGIEKDIDYAPILENSIYLLKPNEHETEMLTGITVKNLESARKAAERFFAMGIENVCITHGSNGAYLFTGSDSIHVPAAEEPESKQYDQTGCGDQTMAVLCSEIVVGRDLTEACRMAMLAGALQYSRIGIQPVTRADVEQYIKRRQNQNDKKSSD
jgi:ribokinase